MAEKVTWMVLKVDLQCPSCYRKVKKILCQIPQIRDQVYDEQKNLVKITVVCCSPEKIRDKLCCKGKKVIQSIDILHPPPPKPPTKEPDKKPPPPADKPKDHEKPPPPKPADKPKDHEKPPPPKKPDPAPHKEPTPQKPVIPPPPPQKPVVPAEPHPVPVGFCCHQCYEGYGGGPCYHGYGRPPPPPPPQPPCYDNYYGYGKGCYVSRCDYFSEENTSGCTIM